MRVHVHEPSIGVTYSRLPRIPKGTVYPSMYYRVRDTYSDEVIIPFDDVLHSTRMSTDDGGMYFDLYMDSLDIGSVYAIDVMIKEATTLTISDIGRFRVAK